MDGVVDLPVSRVAEPASSSRDIPTVIALTASAVALLMVAWLGQPRHFVADHWYAMLTVEGTTSFTDYRARRRAAPLRAENMPHAFRGPR